MTPSVVYIYTCKRNKKTPLSLIPTPFRVPCEALLPSNSRTKCFFFYHHCISIICPLNSTRCTYPVIRDHPIKHIEPCTTRQTLLHCAATALHCPATRNQDQHGVLARLPTCIPTQGIYPTCVLLCAIVCVCGATPTTRKSNYTGKPAANPIHLSWRLLTSAYLHTYLP